MAEHSSSRNFKLRDSAWMVSLVLSIATLGSLFIGAGVIVGRIQAGVLASDKIADDLKSYISKALTTTDHLRADFSGLQLKVERACSTVEENSKRLDACCPRGGK